MFVVGVIEEWVGSRGVGGGGPVYQRDMKNRQSEFIYPVCVCACHFFYLRLFIY